MFYMSLKVKLKAILVKDVRLDVPNDKLSLVYFQFRWKLRSEGKRRWSAFYAPLYYSSVVL